MTFKLLLGGNSTRQVAPYENMQFIRPATLKHLDRFGENVRLSSDNSKLIVSSSGNDTMGGQIGCIYYFQQSGIGVYQLMQQILPNSSETGTYTGTTMDASADASIIVAGAPLADDKGASSGAVVVFNFLNGSYVEVQRLVPDEVGAGDEFGTAVSLSADGQLLVVGAPFDDETGLLNKGTVYIFAKQNDGTYTKTQQIFAGDPQSNAEFGTMATLSANGRTLVVGAPEDDKAGPHAGAAYVFDLEDGLFVEKQKVTISSTKINEYLGQVIGLSHDASTMVLGMPQSDVDTTTTGDHGATYVYKRDQSGSFVRHQRLMPNPSLYTSNSRFGAAVSLSHDGNIIAVSAPKSKCPAPAAANAAGVVYAYEYNPATGFWDVISLMFDEKAYTTDILLGGTPGSVFVSHDGSSIVAGAWHWGSGTSNLLGAVYLFA